MIVINCSVINNNWCSLFVIIVLTLSLSSYHRAIENHENLELNYLQLVSEYFTELNFIPCHREYNVQNKINYLKLLQSSMTQLWYYSEVKHKSTKILNTIITVPYYLNHKFIARKLRANIWEIRTLLRFFLASKRQ